MFKMKQEDMIALIERRKWGTLCSVCDDGTPYAIECTYFLMNGDICALINPRGKSSWNIARDPRVMFKICESDDLCERFQAISCFGIGEFVSDRNEISKAWDELEKRTGLQPGSYEKHKARFADPSVSSPLFKLKIEQMTGRANWSNE
jgi:nitroimidazol reductase NimA-like FMN-containing flavoprotein (pyridoxamine 5'-phosphate oxidase superfamily)